MDGMCVTGHDSRSKLSSIQVRYLLLLSLILLLAAYLRFDGLGARSLWLDEFCTWHVSRLDLGDSLRWEPELTIPPLYQFTLRVLSGSPRPPEWLLRLPAAVCGILSVIAAYWLGKVLRNRAVGCALAGLVACSVLQLRFSQEARPYTMLVMGSALSITLWYRLVLHDRWVCFCAYIFATVLTFHAHYLAVLAILAQAVWWLGVSIGRRADRRSFKPLIALLIVGLLCAPVIIRSAYFRSTVSQAIQWIEPPTWGSILAVLGDVTLGWPWLLLVLAPSVSIWVLGVRGRIASARLSRVGILFAGREDPCGLLLLWLLCGWLGLAVISWAVQPVMVTRYALPVAVPALLLPLVIGHRIHRYVPLAVTVLFILGTAPTWLKHGREVDPGFRELTAYVEQYLDPPREAIVLTIDEVNYPNWDDMERLALAYYPLEDRPVYELRVTRAGGLPADSILRDPRALYLIVFRAEPFDLIEAAGREVTPIWHEGRSYSRLLFTPYRLMRVAPLMSEQE